MRIRIARVSGFCFGVERVIRLAERGAQADGLRTLGPIIHNPVVVESLRRRGIEPVESLDEARGPRVLIRAHGVPRRVYEEARARGIQLLDGTCPYVKDVQKAARAFEERGFVVLIAGKPDHPEVIGVRGHLQKPSFVVEKAEQVEQLPIPREAKVGIVVQSTFRADVFQEIVEAARKRFQTVEARDTRCPDTEDRQQACWELAREVEVMIVVGGRNSSNTRKLYELSRKAGARAYHIERPEEVREEWFHGVQEVGIIGGASTPPELVEATCRRIAEVSATHASIEVG